MELRKDLGARDADLGITEGQQGETLAQNEVAQAAV